MAILLVNQRNANSVYAQPKRYAHTRKPFAVTLTENKLIVEIEIKSYKIWTPNIIRQCIPPGCSNTKLGFLSFFEILDLHPLLGLRLYSSPIMVPY
jgi:hypothetical protein